MRDKKRIIIKSAKDIFIKKGYLLTCVTDIVEASNVSKGTFYNYFTSKEELAIVIFKQEYSVLYQKIDRVMNDKTRSLKEIFNQTLTLLVAFHRKNAEILNITFSQTLIDDDFKQYLSSVRFRSMEWIKDQILCVYGKKVEPYINDLTLSLAGMIFMYVFVKDCRDKEDDVTKEVVEYVLRRLDALVEDVISKKDILVTKEETANFSPDHASLCKKRMTDLRKAIEELILKLEKEESTDSEKWQYKESLNALLAELNNKETPRDFIIQGTLLYLKHQVSNSLKNDIAALEAKIIALL